MTQQNESKIFGTILRGASWLGLYKGFSQVFSWLVTIIIARILVPQDYGLMSMATIITGYAQIFSELGLGAALVQKEDITADEISSVFWFGMMFSMLLAVSCFPVAYLTAYIFNETRLVPLTKTVSVIFILGGGKIVPFNMMRRDFRFKELGFIEMTSTLISCIAMLIMANLGAGVWTLLGGTIVLSLSKLILTYQRVRWKPLWHFSWNEAVAFIQFGVSMATARSLFYGWTKSDSFFAGRAWSAGTLGFYSLANQLAKIPTDKIVTLINQVSFSAFSRLQSDREQFNQLYLDVTKVIAVVVLPFFIGAYMVGDRLVLIVFNEKWYPMTFVFRYLCIAQIFMSINSINNFVHASQGRPQWAVRFNLLCCMVMPVSFYFAVKHGLDAIVIPWISIFIVICVLWTLLTINKIGVGFKAYFRGLLTPVSAVAFMSAVVWILKSQFSTGMIGNIYINTAASIVMGAIAYAGYIWVVDRKYIMDTFTLFRK